VLAFIDDDLAVDQHILDARRHGDRILIRRIVMNPIEVEDREVGPQSLAQSTTIDNRMRVAGSDDSPLRITTS
jgi:hypothetical protein